MTTKPGSGRVGVFGGGVHRTHSELVYPNMRDFATDLSGLSEFRRLV